MSTSGIVFSGLASGLDTQAIISALLAVEQRPIQQLETRKQSLQTQLNLFGDLESKLKTLRDAADDVRQSTNFLEFAASTSRTDFLTASAGTGAVAGSYDIAVTQLAKSQSNTSLGNTDPDTVVEVSGAGTLSFTIGTDTTDVDLNNATLDDISAAINATGVGITAQVIQVSSNDHRLVVSGPLGQAVTVAGTCGASTLAGELNANQTNSQSAIVDVNGLVITRETNSISDAIPGVTLDLVSASGATNTTVTVTPDASATAAKVKTFVDAYNTVVDFAQAQSELDEEGSAKSELFGDITVRTIRNALRGLVGADAQTSNAKYTLFSQVGIDSDSNGRLTFTQTELESAVATDELAVKELFSDKTNGIATKVHTQVDDYLDTVDGILVSRKNGFNTRIQDTDNQISAAERRLTAFQASLEQRFANLEILMNQLQGQGAALGGIISPSRR